MAAQAKKIILVVDDDPDILYATKKFLEKKGFEVPIAVNGREALDYIKENTCPDLIILDIQMKEMDGYTFINELNKLNLPKKIPSIVISAYSELEQAMLLKGVNKYMIKPVHPEDLLEKVKECLR